MKKPSWRDLTLHGVGAAHDVGADADHFIMSVGRKAKRNKRRARLYVMATGVTTTSIPAVVAISETPLWVKLTTLGLSLVLVGTTVALDLDRPHERWALYRKYQRLVEVERSRFRYGLDSYADLSDAEKEHQLAEKITALENDLHQDWERLMPSRAEILDVTRWPTLPRG